MVLISARRYAQKFCPSVFRMRPAHSMRAWNETTDLEDAVSIAKRMLPRPAVFKGVRVDSSFYDGGAG